MSSGVHGLHRQQCHKFSSLFIGIHALFVVFNKVFAKNLVSQFSVADPDMLGSERFGLFGQK
jgi:hypothetical protein